MPVRIYHQMSHTVFTVPILTIVHCQRLTLRFVTTRVQLQRIDLSFNQRGKKQAPPQWGQTLYQVAFLFKIIFHS